ncbi:MAG: hypothetical protein KGR98_05400 [Verrucomicrobia bacterium]|nr:hypothetical protein [Verrucomicrobiota bacterium]MDE3099543.1 hypothetical protein [Verrucomicrobiota bacterium]
MTLKTRTNQNRPRGVSAGFTLAEVLIAMLFMAIVIPAVLEAMRVASLAGEVSVRKGEAARIANRILNESIVTTNWEQGGLNGTVADGPAQYAWTLTSRNWPTALMEQVTARVTFDAQDRSYAVELSTLAPPQTLNAATTTGGRP